MCDQGNATCHMSHAATHYLPLEVIDMMQQITQVLPNFSLEMAAGAAGAGELPHGGRGAWTGGHNAIELKP